MRRLPALVLLALSAQAFGDAIAFVDALELARKQVQVDPNDAEARFALGRLASIGFASNPETIEVTIDRSGILRLPKSESVLVRKSEGPLTPSDQGFLREAVTNLNRAARSSGNNPLYALANAWMFEQLASHWEDAVGAGSFGEFGSAKDAWAKVAAEYRRAWNMAKDKDRERKVTEDDGPDARVSKRAAEEMLRLRKEGKAKVTDAEAKRFQDTIDALGG